LANKESSANVENALNHYSRAKQAEAKLDEVSILADEILVESVNSVCEFPMKVIAAKLQAQLDSKQKSWELMKADRDLWKSRNYEPYDESVLQENIKLQAQLAKAIYDLAGARETAKIAYNDGKKLEAQVRENRKDLLIFAASCAKAQQGLYDDEEFPFTKAELRTKLSFAANYISGLATALRHTAIRGEV